MATVDGEFATDSRLRRWLVPVISGALCLFVLLEVNFAQFSPLKGLALFATAGLVLCFLLFPLRAKFIPSTLGFAVDWLLIVLALACCGYLLCYGAELGQRAGIYETRDLVVGLVGLLLVLEATRRSIGWALPILALLFVIYSHQSVAQQLPDWLFPHRGQDFGDLIGQTYLRTEGVFGTALSVMFKYVFLFVLFGAFLEASGATGYIIALSTRIFGNRAGGPAKVSVLASGLMGSLSGSAVANAATTGTFTIPLMRSIGFKPHIAAGIEAAASSGGALVPPVMGAGAYMMLEIINRTPPVTYLEIVRAALIPALLYYFSIFLLVHFYAKRLTAIPAEAASGNEDDVPDTETLLAAMSGGAGDAGDAAAPAGVKPGTAAGAAPQAASPIFSLEGLIFFGALGSLMFFLLMGNSPFRSVTYSLAFVMMMIIVNPRTTATRVQRAAAAVVWTGCSLVAWWLLAVAANWTDAMIWGMAAALLCGLGVRAWREMIVNGFLTAGRGGVPLIVAAACVGIIIGLVSRTGIGTGVPQAIIPLAGDSLFLALLAIMVCSIVLGMGLPSAVSYLLLATVIGPVFADPALGVPILAAHLFIFYFGMMAMVTPPVALAAYATSSIAGSNVMQTSLAAFRFSLVGFTLPFMFVYRPELCLMGPEGGAPDVMSVVLSVAAACLGVIALAAGMSGYLFSPLNWWQRMVAFAAAASSLYPDQTTLGPSSLSIVDLTGAALLAVVAVTSYRRSSSGRPSKTS